MDPLASFGLFGALLVLIWIIASLLVPFLIWGIYNQSVKSRKELERIREALEAGR